MNNKDGLRSKFITFEGCDNTGKTTQMELMERYLRSRGFAVLVTREPGGTLVGEQIRRLLLDSGRGNLTPVAEALLFCADRANHIEQVIRPALEQGKIVLCDRHLDSTIAYQGYGLGVDISWINSIHHYVLQGLEPDLTFLFVEGGVALESICQPDLVESRSQSFKDRVRDGFLNIAVGNKQRVRVVSVDTDPFTMHMRVRRMVVKLILSTTRRKEVLSR